MGACIIAAGMVEFANSLAEKLGVGLEVALGLGFVIFVHELGHFTVAKLCGVKCEKFYLGFDVYGLKLARFQWGETEYGIGILPLGGYVKMLGQDDNPNNAADERARATIGEGASTPNPSSGPAAAQFDPRSYVAKSVPQRMAIISAGVIMNLIFAVIMASIAYSMGVKELPCAIGSVLPGEAAWRADMRPGDQIVKIGDEESNENLRFRDLQAAVMFADAQHGVKFKIKRDGVAEPFWVTVKPDSDDKSRLRPTIGVRPDHTTSLYEKQPAIPGSVAAATEKFQGKDKIVAIGGVPVTDYTAYIAQLAKHPDKSLEFRVERETGKDDTSTFDINVPPQPRRVLGLQMKYGQITAVQENSPAANAGIKPGDFIESIDGKPLDDPMGLADRLAEDGAETISFTVQRDAPGGQSNAITKTITLRDATWYEESVPGGTPMSVPALGIAYKVLNIVHATTAGSPAAQAELTKDGKAASSPHFVQGDKIAKAEFLKGTAVPLAGKEKVDLPEPIDFTAEKPNWPYLCYCLQIVPPGVTVRLTLEDGRTTELAPVDSIDSFNPDRGLLNDTATTIYQAKGPIAALAAGARETFDSSLLIYRFLNALITGRVSPKNLGGPLSIFNAASDAASVGAAQLLLFLTMLSANLAVINFLPIPLLDGGHIVFLVLEGILRRPVNEKVVVAFHYVGYLFIISLMLFVLGLDFHLIPRTH